jgi:hypothetical protein
MPETVPETGGVGVAGVTMTVSGVAVRRLSMAVPGGPVRVPVVHLGPLSVGGNGRAASAGTIMCV